MKRVLALSMLSLLLLNTPALSQPKGAKPGSEAAQKLNPFPTPSSMALGAILPWFTMGAVLCGAGGLIGASLFKKTELTNEEAWGVVASCFLPGIGSYIVKALFARHPDWNKWHCEPLDRDKMDLMKISAYSPKCWKDA